MKKVQKVQDLYQAIDELATGLAAAGESRLAATLRHRLHEAAWSTSCELLEELHDILTRAIESEMPRVPPSLKEQTEGVLRTVENFLGAHGSAGGGVS